MHPRTSLILTIHPSRFGMTPGANDDWSPDAPACAAAALRPLAPFVLARCAA